jgi:hypothetical protein
LQVDIMEVGNVEVNIWMVGNLEVDILEGWQCDSLHFDGRQFGI